MPSRPPLCANIERNWPEVWPSDPKPVAGVDLDAAVDGPVEPAASLAKSPPKRPPMSPSSPPRSAQKDRRPRAPAPPLPGARGPRGSGRPTRGPVDRFTRRTQSPGWPALAQVRGGGLPRADQVGRCPCGPCPRAAGPGGAARARATTAESGPVDTPALRVHGLEIRDLHRLPVLEDREVLGGEAGDRAALLVHDGDVEPDHPDVGAELERRRLLPGGDGGGQRGGGRRRATSGLRAGRGADRIPRCRRRICGRRRPPRWPASSRTPGCAKTSPAAC